MFQTIHTVHLRDRFRGKKLRTQLEYRFSPYLSGRDKEKDMIGITNLFILATAALATIIPKDTSSSATGGVAKIHAGIDSINSGLLAVGDNIKNFNATAIVLSLERLGDDVMQVGKDVAAGDAVSSSEAMAIIFYVKNAMAIVVDETLMELRRAKSKISRAGRLEDVIMALKDLWSYTVVLGSVLLSKIPDSRKVEGKEVLDEIVKDFQDAIKYFES